MQCPLCEKMAQCKYVGHTGYQEPDVYDIYHCSHCVTAFCHPLEVNHSIYDLIYSKSHEISGYDHYQHHAKQVLKQKNPLLYLQNASDTYWAVSTYLINRKKRPNKILEIGCGYGYLIYALRKAGYDAIGIDISSSAIDNAKKHFGDYYICADAANYYPNNAETFDVVILTEVIEHIPEVQKMLKTIHALLSPGGDLILTTPNRSAFPLDILWETEPPPVHLWWFSEKSIAHLAHQTGFKVKFLSFKNLKKPEEGIASKKFGNFRPSRLPRLDEYGNILQIGNHVPDAIKPPSSSKIKRLLKASLQKIGLLSILRAVKAKVIHHRRSTMCAIMKKK